MFSFHQREQKWEMCYILASPSTALSHFNCAWCISKRKQTNKWHWAVLEVIVGTIWTNYISWWATQCNTKNRVTGYKKQTPKTTPTPQLDGRAAILFPNTSSPLYFHAVTSPTPPPGPTRPPAGEAPHRPHGSCRRPAVGGTGASRSALLRHGGRRAGTGGTARPGERGGRRGRGGGRREGEGSSAVPTCCGCGPASGGGAAGTGDPYCGPPGGGRA